jgi:DNA-binding MarR family transcriptional regulator
MDELSSPLAEPGPIDPIVELLGFRLSTATVLFHSAIAERLGLGATELKCYSIIRQAGPLTAGELSERVGLTTGAITGVVDRLEAAGLVRRDRDLNDRRRVVLALLDNPQRERALLALYEPLGRAITALVAGYSAAEQATIARFLGEASGVLEAETGRLRMEAERP